MEKPKNNIIEVKSKGAVPYHIYLEQDFKGLPEAIGELETENRKICIVTDSNVKELYAREILDILKPCAKEVFLYAFPAGEPNKNLDQIRKLYEFLIEKGMDRKDLLVALGGGVTGDMTGFAAATYLRGIRFIQIPTTLLAQVDSSIGGKTGVDFDCYKNMVGAFHQPSLVYINISTLKTLTEEQFACGMGEVLKHGIILDSAYYEWIIDHMSEIGDRSMTVLLKMVHRSCEIKAAVVEKDPTEQGERALLNFGHTIGHAIEKLKDFTLLHGQCVSLGMVAASYISYKRGLISSEEFYEIRDMNVGFGLPITYDGLDAKQIIAATKKDKKMVSGNIRFILLKKIGQAFIDNTVTEEEMLEALQTMDADFLMNKA